MYLNKRTYVKNWDYMQPGEKHQILVKRGGKVVPKNEIDPAKISYIEQEVGYWRKANAIHNWFVTNCANDEDNQQSVYVTAENLQDLLALCQEVIRIAKIEKGKVQNGAVATDKGWEPIMEDGDTITNPEAVAKLLPTQSGFFFGGTDYDQYYYEDIKHTIKIIQEALKDPDADFTYQADW